MNKADVHILQDHKQIVDESSFSNIREKEQQKKLFPT